MTAFKNIVGQKFFRLEVISHCDEKRGNHHQWICKCDCGNTHIVTTASLNSGTTKSCGCLMRETSAKLGHASKTHGMRDSRVYRIWARMKQRCKPNSKDKHKYYFDRGIKVCQRWQTFNNFYADMGEPPKDYTLERINNDGNYEASNCKWASRKEQANNRSNTISLTFQNETLTLQQWSDKIGIKYTTLYSRYITRKLPPEKVLIA